jgi:hypothetical protein
LTVYVLYTFMLNLYYTNYKPKLLNYGH